MFKTIHLRTVGIALVLLVSTTFAQQSDLSFIESKIALQVTDNNHPSILLSSEFNFTDASQDAQTGIQFLNNLADICSDPGKAAYKSMKVLSKIVPFGEVAMSLINLFVGINLSDPNMAKLNEIQNQINNLQDRMMDEFKNTQKVINSVDCKGRLSEHKNVIQSAFRELMNYAYEKDNSQKEIFHLSLKEGLFNIKSSLNYIMASSVSQSTSDLSACPILDIIYVGDESTDFMVGSDAAVFTMANVMITEAIFGTTVIAMIYELEFGHEKAQAMISREYGPQLELMQSQIKGKLELWTNHPIANLEKNVKQIWIANKDKDSDVVAVVLRDQLYKMLPQYYIFVQVETDREKLNYQFFRFYNDQLCSHINTKNWDATAPKKTILICFGKDELFSNPNRLSYALHQTVTTSDVDILEMQDKYADILYQLNKIQEKEASSFSGDAQDIVNLYFKDNNSILYSLGVRGLFITWAPDSVTSTQVAPTGMQPIQCDPKGEGFPTTKFSRCFVGFGDRVIRILSSQRWIMSAILDIQNPLDWE